MACPTSGLWDSLDQNADCDVTETEHDHDMKLLGLCREILAITSHFHYHLVAFVGLCGWSFHVIRCQPSWA